MLLEKKHGEEEKIALTVKHIRPVSAGLWRLSTRNTRLWIKNWFIHKINGDPRKHPYHGFVI